jgi:hypothetical protein
MNQPEVDYKKIQEESENDWKILYIFIIYIYVYCYYPLYFLWSV